jgi:hypothetical protein
MQIKRAKTVAEYLSSACRTATFSTIPGLPASQIISGLKIASLNSRVFCSPGMGPNVVVLHVDD